MIERNIYSKNNNDGSNTLVSKKFSSFVDIPNLIYTFYKDIEDHTRNHQIKENMKKLSQYTIQQINDWGFVKMYDSLLSNVFYNHIKQNIPSIEETRYTPDMKRMLEKRYHDLKLYHGIVAISLLFNLDDLVKLTNSVDIISLRSLIDNAKNEIKGYGIFNDSTNKFIEKNYLEYFVAYFLWVEFTKMSLKMFKNEFLPFISNNLMKHEHLRVLWFFYFIAKDRITNDTELEISKEKLTALQYKFDEIDRQISNNLDLWLNNRFALMKILIDSKNDSKISALNLNFSLWCLSELEISVFCYKIFETFELLNSDFLYPYDSKQIVKYDRKYEFSSSFQNGLICCYRG